MYSIGHSTSYRCQSKLKAANASKEITKLKMKCPKVFYRDAHHGDIKNSFIAVCITFQRGLRLTFQKSLLCSLKHTNTALIKILHSTATVLYKAVT